jgi:hypothetical protein
MVLLHWTGRRMGSKTEIVHFNAERALGYAEEIAFPRMVGTEGERRAGQTIKNHLEGLGYEVREEVFSIRRPPWLWMKGFPFISLILLLGAWVTSGNYPFAAFMIVGTLVLWILIWDKLWLCLGQRVLEEGDGRRGSRNIVAYRNEKEEGIPLYFVAHYDSKSQPLSLYLRTGLLVLGSILGILFGLWVWGTVLGIWGRGGQTSVPGWAYGCFLLASGVSLFFTVSRMGNRSEGAVDNASGVGILLELARVLGEHPPNGLSPVFLFTGAEEFGVLGSLMYQKKHGEEMAAKNGLLINIDSVGERRCLRGCASGREGKRWLKRLRHLAEEQGFDLRPIPFLKGILMDHLPFSRVGIPSVSFTSVFKEGWYLHTARDQRGLLKDEGLGEMGRWILTVVRSLERTGGG